MWIVPLTLLVAVIAALYLWLQHHYSYWSRRGVPHEKPQFFVGNMKGIGSTYHFKDINERIYRQFKKPGGPRFVGFYTFLSPTFMVLDPELIKHILIKDFGSFADRGLFHNVRDDPLTGNLLFLDGEPWRLLRHKLSPVFTTGKIRFMLPMMVAVGKRMVETCGALVVKTAGDIEMKDLFARYTTDVIGTCAFGIECNSLKNPNAEFRRMGRQLLEEPRHSLIIQTLLFSNPSLARRLRMKLFSDEDAAFFLKAVRETVMYRGNNVKRNDFMDLLIELKAQRDKLHEEGGSAAVAKDDMSNGLTLEQVAAQALVFFLAGFETSSTTMTFCIYELAKNPDIQNALRREIAEVLGKHGGQITYEAVKDMTYLDMVINETLRKYSVLPHIVRQNTSAYRIPDSNLILERGTHIIIPVDAMHNDPEYYPQPEKFMPERFTADEVKKRLACTYLPFGDGPRNCIGSRFGKLQTAIGVIHLVRHFKFSPNERTPRELSYSRKGFVIAPKGGIQMHIDALEA